MEESSERDKRKGKAKVEETDEDSLPPKSNSNTNVEHYYLKLCGELRTKDAVGPEALEGVTRNLFRVRNKDIPNDVKLQHIQKASGATIGLYSDPEVRIDHHTYLELLGTVNEVKIAEILTEDAINEIYKKPSVPTALMPTSVCYHRMPIPLPKVTRLLGFNGNNLVKMEAQSGAWIEVQLDTNELPSAGEAWMREVIIFGSPLQLTNAMDMIIKIVSEEPVIQDHIWDTDIPEDVWDIIADGVTSTAEAENQESATLKGENKQDACVEETAHNDSVKEAAAAEDNRSDQLG